MEQNSPWLTVQEAAERMRLKSKTLRNYISRGLVPVYRNPHTGTVRIRKDEIDKWLEPSVNTTSKLFVI